MKRLKKSIHLVLKIFTILVFCLMLILMVFRLSSPFINHLHAPLLNYLQHKLNIPISFKHIDMNWQGNTIELVLEDVSVNLDIGNEVDLKAHQIQVHFNLYEWLYHRKITLNQVYIDQIQIDLRLKSVTNQLRKFVSNAFEYLPLLGDIQIDLAHFKLFNREAQPLLQLNNLSGNAYKFDNHNQLDIYLYDKYLTLSEIQALKKSPTSVNNARLSIVWQNEQNAQLYFNAQKTNLHNIVDLENLNLSGEIWGLWQQPELAWMKGELQLEKQNQTQNISFSMQDQKNQAGYWYELKIADTRLQALLEEQRSAVQIDNLNSTNLDLWFDESFKKVFPYFSVKYIKLSSNPEDLSSKKLELKQIGFDLYIEGKKLKIADLDIEGKITPQGNSLYFPKTPLNITGDFFKIPLNNTVIDGSFSWQKEAQSLTFKPNLVLYHDKTQASIDGELLIKHDERSQIIANLGGEAHTKDIPEGLKYLPDIFPASVGNWLEKAHISGQLDSALTWKLQGDLHAFPFPQSNSEQNIFNIHLPFKKTSFNALEEKLPRLEDLAGTLDFTNTSMLALGKGLIANNLYAQNITVNIKDFKKATLEIQGNIKGALNEYFNFVKNSPLLTEVHSVLNNFQADKSSTELKLEIATPLSEKNQSTPLKLKGILNFNQAKLLEKNTKTELNKIQGQLSFNEQGLTNTDQALEFSVFDTDSQLIVNTEKEQTLLSFDGNFNLNKILSHYVPALTDLFQFKGNALVKTTISIPKDKNTFSIKANTDLKNTTIDAPFGLDKVTSSQAELNFSLDHESNRTHIKIDYDHYLDFSLTLNKMANNIASLKILTDSSEGKASLQDNQINVSFSRLLLPERWNISHLVNYFYADKNSQSINIKTFPTLNISIDNIFRNNTYLGNLQCLSHRDKDTYFLDYLHLSSSNKLDLQLNGNINYQKDAQANIKLVTQESSALNQLLNTDLGITGNMIVDAKFFANTALSPLSLNDINGSGYILIKNGFLRKIETGPLYILGLLNLDTLGKRLRFDFSDFYNKGMAFDRIHLPFNIKYSLLTIDNTQIIGPIGETNIQGALNLQTKTHNLDLIITPSTSIAIPIIGTIAGGPAVGAGLLVTERIFSQKINSLINFHYKLQGKWESAQFEEQE